MLPSETVETTCLLPNVVRLRAGNVEINADYIKNGFEVFIDGVKANRVRKAVVTLEMDSAATVEITMIPEHS